MGYNETHGFCVTSVPTFWERLMRWAGYRYRFGDEPDGMSEMAGWIQTSIRLNFSWLDRFRLLATGNLRVTSVVVCEVHDVGKTASRVDYIIVAPGVSHDR
jgi:hypothetical protein